MREILNLFEVDVSAGVIACLTEKNLVQFPKFVSKNQKVQL